MIFYTFITNNIIKCGIDLNYSVCDVLRTRRDPRDEGQAYAASGGKLKLTYYCAQFFTTTPESRIRVRWF